MKEYFYFLEGMSDTQSLKQKPQISQTNGTLFSYYELGLPETIPCEKGNGIPRALIKAKSQARKK